MSARWFTGICATLCIAASSAGGQDSSGCDVPVPRYGDGLEFFDRLEVLYHRLDSAFTADLAAGTARLEPTVVARLDLFRNAAQNAFARVGAKESGRSTTTSIFLALGAYADFLGAGYTPDIPPRIQRLLCPIRASYLGHTKMELEEHDRQMEVRYGKLSERLNIAEMLVDQWLSRKLGVGQLRTPPRLEAILRAQVIGYQYDSRVGQLRPSSPTMQVGASWYVFGGPLRFVNHIGLAAAYQHDYAEGGDLWGGVLHVRDYDVGFLCPKLKCDDYVIVASRNFSVFADMWTRMRKFTNRN